MSYFPNQALTSTVNSSTTPLNNGDTFTGTAELNTLSDVMVSCETDKAGLLYFDFSQNGTNWTVFPTSGFTVTANVHEFHVSVKGPRYFRVRLTNNSGENQTTLRLKTYYGSFQQGNLPLNQSVSSDADARITRSVILGKTDGGVYTNVPVTNEGHIEVAIHAPRLPFGSIHTEKITPVFQTDFVYGINESEIVATTGINGGGSTSATTTAVSNVGICSTGTTSLSFASMQSRKRLRYRAGQGVVGRYTALFSTPAASSILVAGLGTGESGLYFGYNGTSFGILHSTGGVREIQTLTVTTASTATNNYNVTLAGTAFTVPATNNSSTVKTAYEISQGTYTGWKAEQIGSTVIFLADAVGNKAGTFSLAQSGAGVPAAGSFAETLAGAISNDTWIPQASWNVDVMDGTGSASNPSGVLLNPSKGNVYQIGVQYLGFGAITFEIETSKQGNNPTFSTVHVLNIPNTQTTTSVSQPSFPFTMSAYSTGSTTDVSVKCGSFSGFIEGDITLTGPRMSFYRETNGVVGSTAATYYPLFTIRNDYVHSHSGNTDRANQSVVNLLSIAGSNDDATPITFFLIKNGTLGGTPNFEQYSSVSCTSYDDDATSVTFTNNAQIIFTLPTGQSSGEAWIFEDDITLQPGETLTLAARAVTGTATYVNAGLNTREDQ